MEQSQTLFTEIEGKKYMIKIPLLYNKDVVVDLIASMKYSLDSKNNKLIITGLSEPLELYPYDERPEIVLLKEKVTEIENYIKEKQWFKIGKLSEYKYNTLQTKYSLFKYEYGLIYNTVYPRVIDITNWNQGLRFMFKFNYPQGDGANMFIGNTIFKKDTTDSKDVKTSLQKYVKLNNGIYEEYSSNGETDLDLYARRF